MAKKYPSILMGDLHYVYVVKHKTFKLVQSIVDVGLSTYLNDF